MAKKRTVTRAATPQPNNLIKWILIAGAIALGIVILSQQNLNMGCNPPREISRTSDTVFTPYEVTKIIRDTIRIPITIVRRVVVPDVTTGVAKLDTTIDRGGINVDTMSISYATRTSEFTLIDRPAPRTRDTVFKQRDREINTEVTVEESVGFFQSIGKSITSIATHILAAILGYGAAKVLP